MNLRDYIGEATAYDKKLMLERKDPTSWLKSVSAFAAGVAVCAWADTWTDPDTGYTWTHRINGNTAEYSWRNAL